MGAFLLPGPRARCTPPHVPRHLWALCVQDLPRPPPPAATTPAPAASRVLRAPHAALAPLRMRLPGPVAPSPASSPVHPRAGLLLSYGTCVPGPLPPPVGSLVASPACHACEAPLTWALPKYYTHCPSCALVNIVRSRQCPPPATPPPPPAHDAPVLLSVPAAHTEGGRPLAVEDYLWSSLTRHPTDDNWLLLARRGIPVALVPARWAAAARATCLLAWRTWCPTLRLNEMDVTATVLAAVLSGPSIPPPPAGAFPGDSFLFAPPTWMYEPGAVRPLQALPVPGPVHPAHPAASPFLPVTDYGLPLSADAYNELLQGMAHPYHGFIVNSLRVGFPTTATPPTTHRPATWATPPLHDPLVRKVLAHERDIHATIDASSWPAHAVPLRHCPLYAILKSSGVAKRLVQDLSAGADAVNATVHTPPLPPVRLTKIQRACDRVLRLRAARPGVPIYVQRIDLMDAYRRCPLASNNRWQITHKLRDGTILASNALVLGIASACASMSVLTTVVEDVYAQLHGIFAGVYIDDTIVIDYADCIDATVARLIADFQRLGWTVHQGKLLQDGPPATRKAALGVLIDTEAMTVEVPADKLATIIADLAKWRAGGPHTLTPSRARALAGVLNWCATTLPLARPFLAPLYDFGYGAPHAVHGPPSRQSPPPPEVLDALSFWQEALSTYNGTSSFAPVPPASTIHLQSDASGHGWGFICPATGEYSQGRWSALERKAYSTTHWEAVAACGAGIAFGDRVPGGVVSVAVDSASSFHALNRLRCRDARLRALLRTMCLIQIRCRFRLVLTWIPGSTNVWADHLSRHDDFPSHLWPSSAPAPRRLPAWWRPRPTTTTPSSPPPQPSPFNPSQAPGKPTPLPSGIGTATALSWAVNPSTPLPLIPSRGH